MRKFRVRSGGAVRRWCAPDALDLPPTCGYVGSSDVPAPTEAHRYVTSEWDEDVVIFRCGGTVSPDEN